MSMKHIFFFRNVATINTLEEFLDSIHTQLDELWRLPQNYPQNRMIDLMDIICRFCKTLSFHCRCIFVSAFVLFPSNITSRLHKITI